MAVSVWPATTPPSGAWIASSALRNRGQALHARRLTPKTTGGQVQVTLTRVRCTRAIPRWEEVPETPEFMSTSYLKMRNDSSSPSPVHLRCRPESAAGFGSLSTLAGWGLAHDRLPLSAATRLSPVSLRKNKKTAEVRCSSVEPDGWARHRPRMRGRHGKNFSAGKRGGTAVVTSSSHR